MRVKMSEIGKRKLLDPDVYKVECMANEETTFASGAWGFNSRVASDNGTGVFSNLVVLDAEGGPSKAFFRFKQQYEGLTGSELDADYAFDEDDGHWYDADDNRVDVEEIKDLFRDRATEMVGHASEAETQSG
jgi:hypothetical protein